MLPEIYDPEKKTNDVVFTEFTRYEIDHDGFGGLQIMRAVMSERYKLVIHLLDTDEFYDLQNDPYEMNNLINDETYADIRNKMHDKLIEHMNQTRDLYRGYQWHMRPWRKDFVRTGRMRDIQDNVRMKSMNQDSSIMIRGLPMETAVRKEKLDIGEERIRWRKRTI